MYKNDWRKFHNWVMVKAMAKHRIFTMPFSDIYPAYILKAERKNRTKAEVDEIIRWLTGYGEQTLRRQLDKNVDVETFFAEAPQFNPNASKIKGVICGYRVEEIEDELMRKIRCLDKLIDELAKGKTMDLFDNSLEPKVRSLRTDTLKE